MTINGYDHSDRTPARDPVSLDQAFAWSCPDCQQRNFVESQHVVFEDEAERREAYLTLGMIEDWEETPPADAGQFLMAPSTVQCSRCRKKFPSVDDNITTTIDGSDDDED